MPSRRVQKIIFRVVILLVLAILGGGLQQHGQVSLPSNVKIDPGYYEVTRVSDGDTIKVRIAGKVETVRLIGIDTPEEFDRRKPVQCFAKAAADHMHELVEGKSVRLEGDPTNSDRDKYHRLLRYVYLRDGSLVNAVQIEQGYAFAYVLYPFSKMDQFRELERQARENSRGLWAGCQVHKEGEKEQTQSLQ